jgi:holo-[acyl-carrier protein] synthase
MLTVGVDLVEIGRIEGVLARFGERFLARIYTPAEQAYCRGRGRELAARFAAKEAVSKALGTGLRGVSWREIEVLPDALGKPLVHLHGRAQQRAAELGLTQFAISLSHERGLAIAFVVAT